MSKRPEVTKELSLALERYINPKNDTRIYMAKEVTFDYATGHAIRVDYMRFKPVNNTVSGVEKGDFYCYEIKSSVEDFHSGHGLNFIGDYNYLVMPEEVYAAVSKEIPYFVGVIVPTESTWRNNWRELTVIKKAKRSVPVAVCAVLESTWKRDHTGSICFMRAIQKNGII